MAMATSREKIDRSLSRMAVGRLLGIGVDGVAEQDELEQRNADHHAERDPIPAHLPEFLDDHCREPARRKRVSTCHHDTALRMRLINTSSRLEGIRVTP